LVTQQAIEVMLFLIFFIGKVSNNCKVWTVQFIQTLLQLCSFLFNLHLKLLHF